MSRQEVGAAKKVIKNRIDQIGLERWCDRFGSLLQDTIKILRRNGRIILSDRIYFAEGAFIAASVR